MAVINTQQRGNGTSSEFVILPTDVYRMKITYATVEEDQYGEIRPDGTKPEKLVITWEVTELTPEQEEIEGSDAFLGGKVWQRFNPYYGGVRDGGVSKFKAFIDQLRAQNFLTGFNPDAFDTDDLVGIEQRVSVEEYLKSQGPNAGKPGNKVVSVLPLRRPKAKPKPEKPTAADIAPPGEVPEVDLPF